MVLFKSCRGNEKDLPITLTDGCIYFCIDTGNVYIDYENENNEIVRSKISAEYADKLRYIKDGETVEIDASEVATITDIKQSDWDENDPTSPKYIENRTHYKKPTYPSDAPVIETLTAGATLLYDFTGLSATYINRILYKNAADPDCQHPFEWSWEAKLSTSWMAAESTSAGNGFAEKIDDANFRIMGSKTYDFYLYFISDPALLSAEYAGRFPSKGIYVTVNDAGTANIRNFKGGFVYVAQLKQNYIPDSIARTDDVLPKPETATVGQVIAVQAVDADGKVTETVGRDVATEEDALELMAELNIINPVASADNTLYTSNTGAIYTL